jgi:hypothetical protein
VVPCSVDTISTEMSKPLLGMVAIYTISNIRPALSITASMSIYLLISCAAICKRHRLAAQDGFQSRAAKIDLKLRASKFGIAKKNSNFHLWKPEQPGIVDPNFAPTSQGSISPSGFAGLDKRAFRESHVLLFLLNRSVIQQLIIKRAFSNKSQAQVSGLLNHVI